MSTAYEYVTIEEPQNLETSTPGIYVHPSAYGPRRDSPVAMDSATIQFMTVQFTLRQNKGQQPESDLTALMSEEAIAKIWDTPAEDEAWQDL